MSDTADVQTSERLTTCHAALTDGAMVCARCGFEWPESEKSPVCDPITFEHLRARMAGETTHAETSLEIVLGLAAHGTPADAEPARRRLAELNAVLRLVERCAGDGAIKAILNGKKHAYPVDTQGH